MCKGGRRGRDRMLVGSLLSSTGLDSKDRVCNIPG